MHKGRSKRGTAAAASPEGPGTARPAPCVERGNFTHAFCAECGWEGPARRARGVAVHDGQLHALAGCGDTAAQEQRGRSVPDRERLSAHGRS